LPSSPLNAVAFPSYLLTSTTHWDSSLPICFWLSWYAALFAVSNNSYCQEIINFIAFSIYFSGFNFSFFFSYGRTLYGGSTRGMGRASSSVALLRQRSAHVQMFFLVVMLLSFLSCGKCATTTNAPVSVECNLALQNVSADPWSLFQSTLPLSPPSYFVSHPRIHCVTFLLRSDTGLRQISKRLGVSIPLTTYSNQRFISLLDT